MGPVSGVGLAAFLPDESATPQMQVIAGAGQAFNIEGFIERHKLVVRRGPVAYNNGTKYELNVCPFNSDHTGGSAVITRGANGALGFRCLHNSYEGKGWRELREKLEGPRAPAPDGPGKSLTVISMEEILRREYPAPRFVIPRLLAHGITLCCGRPKVGKSWLALQLALAVAKGTRVLEYLPAPHAGRVLYLALEESPGRTGYRTRQFVKDAGGLAGQLDLVYSIDPLLAGGAAQLDKTLTANPARLVIIDTFLAILQSGGASKRDILRSDYAEIKVLSEIAAQHDCAILVIHHLRKAAAEYGLDAVAGTTGMTASADSIWTLTRTPSGSCRLEIQGRDMPDAVYELTFASEEQDNEPFGWRIVAAEKQVGMSVERKRVLDAIGEGATLAQVAAALGKDATTTRRLIQKLVTDALISKQGQYYTVNASVSREHCERHDWGDQRADDNPSLSIYREQCERESEREQRDGGTFTPTQSDSGAFTPTQRTNDVIVHADTECTDVPFGHNVQTVHGVHDVNTEVSSEG